MILRVESKHGDPNHQLLAKSPLISSRNIKSMFASSIIDIFGLQFVFISKREKLVFSPPTLFLHPCHFVQLRVNIDTKIEAGYADECAQRVERRWRDTSADEERARRAAAAEQAQDIAVSHLFECLFRRVGPNCALLSTFHSSFRRQIDMHFRCVFND